MEDATTSTGQARSAPQAEPETQPPAKKARVEPPSQPEGNSDTISFNEAIPVQGSTQLQQTAIPANDERRKEIEAGITAFVSPKEDAGGGFSGVLKQRYTDFQVNEILPDGRVCHLKSVQAPKRKREEQEVDVAANSDNAKTDAEPQGDHGDQGDDADGNEAGTIPQDAQDKIETIFGEDLFLKMRSLYIAVLKDPKKKPRDFRSVHADPLQDRQLRTEAHQAIRKAFASRLESTTDGDGSIKISPAPLASKGRGGDFGNAKQKGKPAWHELGGEYLHFTVYKENKDTMEVVSFLASQLKVAPKAFQFGGTKDRRAVTSQRVSAYRIRAEQMAMINKRLRQGRVGDFEYHPSPMSLGATNGNEFKIVLRDCHFPGTEHLDAEETAKVAQEKIAKYVADFQTKGFINYYGLQRFGSFSTSTSTVGTFLLQGDFEGAVAAILEYNPDTLAAAQNESQDADIVKISEADKSRALGIHLWQTTQDSRRALDVIQKRFSAETNIIRHLGQFDKRSGQLRSPTDYFGALQTIPRNLRLMYVHAYQSLVWNHIAGERWTLYGDKVVEGDLVLVHEHLEKQDVKGSNQAEPDVDEAGEPIIRPAGEDAATKEEDFERARPLTASEAASGQYSIFDIVLPLPGFDVEYPKNAVGDAYKTFMASERGGGLDPCDMRRKWRDLSLSGSYRKLIACPKGTVEGSVKLYSIVDEQLATTDGDMLDAEEAKRDKKGGSTEDNGPPPSLVIQASDEDMATPANGTSEQVSKERNGEQEMQVESEPKRLAVILKMQLGSSTYATMALRELLGEGGVNSYKPDFGGGR